MALGSKEEMKRWRSKEFISLRAGPPFQLGLSRVGCVLVYRYTKERNINELRHNSMYGYENNRNSPVYRYTRTAPTCVIKIQWKKIDVSAPRGALGVRPWSSTNNHWHAEKMLRGYFASRFAFLPSLPEISELTLHPLFSTWRRLCWEGNGNERLRLQNIEEKSLLSG